MVEDLKFLAEIYGWKFGWHKIEYSELYFRKGGVGLTIWYTKMLVRTVMTHPRMGNTEMYRKKVDMSLMEMLFDNPRVHTNKGYIKSKQAKEKVWLKTKNTHLSELRQRYIKRRRRRK